MRTFAGKTPTVRLEDGTEKIFLNTKGKLDDVGGELRSLLDYFDSLVPQDAFTVELEEAVAAAREHKEWRQEYMKLELMMMDSRREGRREGKIEGKIEGIKEGKIEGKIEGRKEGKIEGRKEGKIEGKIEGRIELICRKLARGKAPEEIAEDLEIDLSEVQRICDAAAKYAPDYDTEKILEELLTDR